MGSIRLTLLAGGGTAYIYPDVREDAAAAERLATMSAVLDVAYPADETIVRSVPEDRWPEIRAALVADGIEIVDTREGATT